jgi:predicted small metal-binding protein
MVAKQITCECGQVIRGESDDEVISGAREHIGRDHPELVDKVTPDVLLSWVEEV